MRCKSSCSIRETMLARLRTPSSTPCARALRETPAQAVRIADWLISASHLEKANGAERKDARGFIFLECVSQFRPRNRHRDSYLFCMIYFEGKRKEKCDDDSERLKRSLKDSEMCECFDIRGVLHGVPGLDLWCDSVTEERIMHVKKFSPFLSPHSRSWQTFELSLSCLFHTHFSVLLN